MRRRAVEEEEVEEEMTVEDIVADLPRTGHWDVSESEDVFNTVGASLVVDHGIDIEEVQEILEQLFIAAIEEVS